MLGLLTTYIGQKAHDYWYGPEEAAGQPVEMDRLYEGALRDLRLGANVDFSGGLAHFVLGEQAGMSFRAPAEPQRVLRYGTFPDADGIVVDRFYLGVPGKTWEYVLEIGTQDNSILRDDIRLYRLVETIYPTTRAQWDELLVGGIDQAAILGGLNIVRDEIEYGRVWGSSEYGEDAEPMALVERREEVFGWNGSARTLDLGMMLYGRLCGDQEPVAEYLLTTVVTENFDDNQQRWVDVFIGVAINEIDINIF